MRFAGMEDSATLGSDMSAISDLREAVPCKVLPFYCLRGNKSDKPQGSGQRPDSFPDILIQIGSCRYTAISMLSPI